MEFENFGCGLINDQHLDHDERVHASTRSNHRVECIDLITHEKSRCHSQEGFDFLKGFGFYHHHLYLKNVTASNLINNQRHFYLLISLPLP